MLEAASQDAVEGLTNMRRINSESKLWPIAFLACAIVSLIFLIEAASSGDWVGAISAAYSLFACLALLGVSIYTTWYYSSR